MIEVLSSKTGTNIERVRATTLAAYESVLYEKHNLFGPTSWIMPVGIYHRRRRQFGLQYCPHCLAEDKEPYYRRKWRLAFIVTCERHRIVLHDRCPRCEEPINFHRGEMGNHRKFVTDSITRCHVCKYELHTIDSIQIIHGRPKEIEFNATLLRAMDEGFIQISEESITYSHLFFIGLRQLMKIIAMRDKRIVKLRRAICIAHNVEPYVQKASKSTDVQELNIKLRRQLLGITRCLLEDWPWRFVELSRKHKIWSSLWLRHLEPTTKGRTYVAPFWFCSVVREQLYRARYCPSGEEMAAVVSYLQRKGEVVNKSTIARLLGVSVVRGGIGAP